jgi:endonuclease-8
MASPPDLERMVARLRGTDQGAAIGDALLDQRLVAGIGNMWKAEGLFAASVSPWARLSELSDACLRSTLEVTHGLMVSGRGDRHVYRRAGLPCRRCGASIRSRPQGEHARSTYWCPVCQEPVSR